MRFLIACIFLVAATSSQAFDGRGTLQIVDGDTIYLVARKIRLQGIDAPETEQVCLDVSGGRSFACGLDAKSALARRFKERERTWRVSGTDRHRQTLATCFADGQDAGRLVREGWALAFRRHSDIYVVDEHDARSAKPVFWNGALLAPWEWRARSSQTIIFGEASVPVSASWLLNGATSAAAPPSVCTTEGNLRSKPACIYHPQGGRFYGGLDTTEHAPRRWFCSEPEVQAAGGPRSKL